ncbi:MAG: hypothetical protein QW103_00540 [Candidatus Pacearchaeota archaeon]
MVEIEKIQNKAQVWIETVTYTLIGITIIAIILAIALPRIEELKDENNLDSAKNLMEDLYLKINEVSFSPGTQRVVSISITKGSIIFDTPQNSIYFSSESSFKYSEPGIEIKEGNVFIRTEDTTPYKVYLKINYTSINLTLNSRKSIEQITASSVPYKLIIQNKGDSNVDIKIGK